MLRRLFLATATTVLTVLALSGIRGTAAAETQQSAAVSSVQIRNFNNLCMDIGANAPGTVVGTTYCNSNLTSQRWYFFDDQTIRNFNGLCMDIGSLAPGTKVVTTYCRPGYTSQIWFRTGADHKIINANNVCMDIGANAPGTPVVIAACQPGYTSQQWYYY